MSEKRTFEQLAVAYADGELNESDAAAVEARLRESPEWARTVGEFRHDLALVKRAVADTPLGAPPSLEKLLPRVRRRRRARRSLAACAAAALVMMCAGAGLWFRSRPDDATPNEMASPSVSLSPAEMEETRAQLAAMERRLEALESRLAELDRLSALQAAARRPMLGQTGVAREEIAAISVAAGRYREEQAGDVPAALTRYRYAIDHFPETAAAERARRRLSELESNAL